MSLADLQFLVNSVCKSNIELKDQDHNKILKNLRKYGESINNLSGSCKKNFMTNRMDEYQCY